jgi:hypothetical protein
MLHKYGVKNKISFSLINPLPHESMLDPRTTRISNNPKAAPKDLQAVIVTLDTAADGAIVRSHCKYLPAYQRYSGYLRATTEMNTQSRR